MAEEENAPRRTESLIHISPEYAEIVSEALRSRRSRPQDPDVEGHGMEVEQFNIAGAAGVVCGSIYVSN
jgi:hypothetical protein